MFFSCCDVLLLVLRSLTSTLASCLTQHENLLSTWSVQSKNRRWPRCKLNFQSYTYIMRTHTYIYIYIHTYTRLYTWSLIYIYILYIYISLSSIVGINGSSSAPGSDHPQNDSSRHHQVTEFFWATPQVAKSCPFLNCWSIEFFFCNENQPIGRWH